MSAVLNPSVLHGANSKKLDYYLKQCVIIVAVIFDRLAEADLTDKKLMKLDF